MTTRANPFPEGASPEVGALQHAIAHRPDFSSIATDADGVIQVFNVGAEHMLGYTAAEVMNKLTPADISDPAELNARAKALSVELGIPIGPGFEALVFKASRGIEDVYGLTYIRKDGSRFPAMVSVTALRDAQNAIIGYLLIITDKRTGEGFYRTLFECAPDGIVIADPESYFVDANASMCRMLGYTRAELIGLHASSVVSEMEIQYIAPALSVINAANEYHREWQFRRKDGSVFDAEVIATKMPDGNLLGMIRDLSDRKRTGQETADALRELKNVRAAIDEHAIVAIADSKGKITYVNDKFCSISKYSREELLGKDHRIINSGFHPKEFIRDLWQTISAGRVWKGEIKNKAKDGTFYWVSTTIVPYLHAGGRPSQYIAIRADITARKDFEYALREKNIELEASSRLKSEFVANMSHELRTPLNSIIGFSEVLRDGLIGQMTDEQRRCIGDILGSGIHLLSLINDILDLSKVEAGKMTLDLEPVEMSALLMNSLSLLRESATSHRIRLDFDAPEELGAIEADERKLKQIVYNLLSNAVKFTQDGGCVQLRARCVTRAAVGEPSDSWPHRTFPLAENGFVAFLQVSIIDNGLGISRAGLEKLFVPFSQIDSGLSRRFEGTGLGLAMVKRLVDLHGGTVAVGSAVGEGSCFTFWLPLREPRPEVFTPFKARAAPRIEALARARVALVVEPDLN